MILNSLTEAIGCTPVLKLNRLFSKDDNVFIKLEKSNPGGSIKDRIALEMIEEAERSGALKPGMKIVEPTSGNTGIGLALVGAVKGYKVVLAMPESMSIERRKLMLAYGAEFILTPKEKGMKGAIAAATEVVENDRNAWMPAQFDNPANIQAHVKNTAQEILADFPVSEGGLDYVITGVGTGGHITGIAKVLKEAMPNLKVIAVEPTKSPVIGGGEPGPHPLQGIGAGFIPGNLDTSLLDGSIAIAEEDAFAAVKELGQKEGLLAGISTGASIAAVKSKLKELPKGSRVLTINYDTGERYLSVEALHG